MSDVDVRLFNAVTEFDRKQSLKKGYNPYALGHYAKGLQKIRHLVELGFDRRGAIVVCFCDRIRDVMLKAIGEPPAQKFEERRYPGIQLAADEYDYRDEPEAGDDVCDCCMRSDVAISTTIDGKTACSVCAAAQK